MLPQTVMANLICSPVVNLTDSFKHENPHQDARITRLNYSGTV